MSTLELQVGAGVGGANTDDATQQAGGTMALTSVSQVMGSYGGYNHSGYMFTGVSGLATANITGADLQFRARYSDSGSFAGTFYAHDAAAPGTFTSTPSNISDTVQRPRTSESVTAGSTELGSWTSGTWHTYDELSSINIVAIIQELADSHDPSNIAILFIYISGTGERVARSYDYASGDAAKLDIDFEPAGGVEVTPTAHNYAWNIPTPTFSPQTATFTPSAVAYGWQHPTPVIVAGVLIEPSALAYGWSIPTPTWSGVTTYTPTAHNYAWAIPEPSVVAGVSVTPTAHGYGWAIPTPTFSPQTATFTPTAVTFALEIPSPSVSIGEVIYDIWYELTRTIDTNDFPSTAQYYLEVVMDTRVAATPVFARLWNVTDNVEIFPSEISTASTDPIVVRSNPLTLPSTSKSFRVEYGGESGSEVTLYGAWLVVETD